MSTTRPRHGGLSDFAPAAVVVKVGPMAPLLAAGVRAVLSETGEFELVRTGRGGPVDVVVLDPLALDVSAEGDAALVALVSGSRASREAARAMNAAVVVMAAGAVEGLVEAVRAAPGQSHRMGRPHAVDGLRMLTAREADVLRLICQGWSNVEIATEMFLSINTVKTYIRTAYKTMGVTSRSQAVAWGVSRGILTLVPDPRSGEAHPEPA